MKLIVVVDNEGGPGLIPEWGLSIYIDFGDRAIIFDTGASEEVFKYNFENLKLSMDKVVACVISHEHGDHTGGLGAIVEYCNRIPIYLPYPSRLSYEISRICQVNTNKNITKILDNVVLVNFSNSLIPEQCLVIDIGRGVVMITGCSHPGIEHMVRHVMGLFKKDILLLIGGFHLFNLPISDVRHMADKFCRMHGLLKICPLHCTGRNFANFVRELCPERYIPGHAGTMIEISEDGSISYIS